MLSIIKSSLKNLRKTKPVVLCLTNYVTMDFMANVLLAIGAAPIMSNDKREIEELVNISSAININIGTLNEISIKRDQQAIEFAKKTNKPIILDPVGVGASKIRTQIARQIVPFSSIIRGNATEIIALNGSINNSKGVESTHNLQDAENCARNLARDNNLTVVVSGATDFITNNKNEKYLSFGSNLMPLVTGMGCSLTAVIAAFMAVIPDSFKASTIATAYFGLCGELAHHISQKPASFRMAFIDNLYQPDWKQIESIINQTNEIDL